MKRFLKFVVFFYCMIWMGNTVYAETEKVIYSDITAYINGLPIPSYNLDDRTVVIAKELENYGFDLNYVDEERCLYIEYNPEKEVTANYDPQKENKKIGSVAFTVQATDIYARIKGISTRGTSYSINGELLISINELKEQHSCYVTWYEKERKIPAAQQDSRLLSGTGVHTPLHLDLFQGKKRPLLLHDKRQLPRLRMLRHHSPARAVQNQYLFRRGLLQPD